MFEALPVPAMVLLGLLLVGLAMGLPVAFTLGGAATVFIMLFYDPTKWAVVYFQVWKSINTFPLVAIPLFIFMGAVLERSGLAEELFEAIYRWFGGIRGGLAMGTVVICAIFAACTGITGAATVTMGYIALPAMLKRGYKKDLAVGAVAGGGTLGPIIPPSVPLIMIGLFGMVSIGGLFMAGFFSGLLCAFIMIAIIAVRCLFNPELGPAVPKEDRASWGAKFASLRGVVLPGLLVLVVLGSIFSGIATPTEAASVGAAGALVCAGIHRRLDWATFREATMRGFRSSVFIGWIIFGAYAFNSAFGMSGASAFVTDFLLGMPGRWGAIIAAIVLLLIVGMFMTTTVIVMIASPILFPVIKELGFNPFWFGTLMVIAQLVGYISPPFGYNLFYMRGIVPEIDPSITMTDIFRCVIPYIIALCSAIVIIMVFPPIATWLPSLLLGR